MGVKRGTPRHPKTRALARALKIPVAHATGILACLWEHASDFCPDGGIGRLTDEEIAEICDWPEKKSKVLISALTADRSRWIDRIEGCRLFLHDWPDHCEDTVHRKLARAKAFFANGGPPKLTRLTDKERKEAEVFYAQHAPAVRPPCALPKPEPIPKPLPEPEPIPNSPSRRLATLLDSDKADCGRFEEFYERYPHRVGKQETLQNWISYVTPETEAKVFACLERYEHSQEWQRKVYQQPANWLRERARNGWADDPSPAALPAKSARQLQIERL